MKLKNVLLGSVAIFLFTLFGQLARAEETNAKTTPPKDKPKLDFENEEAFIDTQEALRSKQYLRRAIMSTIVTTTGKMSFSRMYLNHLMGFNAIYQRSAFTKYTSGMQGLSLGYVSEKGHALELGLELSAVSNIFAGYRYIYRPEKLSLWPFFGFGAGQELSSLKLSDGPDETRNYRGRNQMGFGTIGFLVPLVEVGLKAEVRFIFYGADRLVLSQGIGAIIFL